MELSANSNLEVSLADSASASNAIQVTVRHYLTSNHLWAANMCASRCEQFEQEYRGRGVPVHPTHRAFAIMAIQSAVALLEALVNEMYQDAAEDAPGRVQRLDDDCRRMMSECWREEASSKLITKFQLALLFRGAEQIDMGQLVGQNVALLTALRNALVHFKPGWHDDRTPTNLEKRLTGRFPKSGLLTATDGSAWPVWALGAGGARWGVVVAKDFADEWMDRMGLPRHYETELEAEPVGPPSFG